MPALDTLGAKKQLTDAGLPDGQAEAIVNAMFGFLTDELATKADLEAVRTELKAEMAELRTGLKAEMADIRTEMADIRTEIANLESRLTNRLYATVIGGIGFISILITLYEFLG